LIFSIISIQQNAAILEKLLIPARKLKRQMKTCSSVWHLISNIIKADANYIVAPAKGQEKKIEE